MERAQFLKNRKCTISLLPHIPDSITVKWCKKEILFHCEKLIANGSKKKSLEVSYNVKCASEPLPGNAQGYESQDRPK